MLDATNHPPPPPSLLIWDLAADRTLASQLSAALAGCSTRPVSSILHDSAAGPEEGPAVADIGLLVVEPDGGDRLADLVPPLRKRCPEMPLLVATRDQPGIDLSKLWQPGVSDLLLAPFRRAELEARLAHLLQRCPSIDPVSRQLGARLGLARLVGESAAFRTAVEQVPLLADCDATVLISGETGTGKEVFARAVHYLSRRAGGPFVAVNCGALPHELVENELFGHEAEAYTGARRRIPGLIQQAEGGTLLLDEVDALPAASQVKLLRFLQEKEYRPLGSGRTQRADVRLIAATNSDVAAELGAGRLRRDLYYRLSVLPLPLPPLRQRGEDVVLLARHFLARQAAEMERATPELTPNALAALLHHRWPGNVRELEHVMERALVLANGADRIDRYQILLEGEPGAAAPAGAVRADAEPEPTGAVPFKEAKRRVVARFERRYIEGLLLAHQGNITHAAEAAGKHRRALFELIRKHQIDVDRYRAS